MTAANTANRQPPLSLRSPANEDPGLFGRLFPGVPPFKADEGDIVALAEAMLATDVRASAALPAGFTYLGQFIDHDITLDLTSIADKDADPDGLENFRTPGLDLDSIYGFGPDGSPHLYERVSDEDGRSQPGAKLLLGAAQESEGLNGRQLGALPGHDLPRQPATGFAIIGDPRNDENLVVAQLHVAFMRFHNRIVDKLAADLGKPATGRNLFAEARRLMTWHYQWIVLHEYLDAITGEPGIADRTIARGRRFFRFKQWPFIPLEFAVAAYRFGHTLVREAYSHNIVFTFGNPPFPPATLPLLFQFTAKSGGIDGTSDLAAVPSNWVIDWRRFFDFPVAPDEPGFVRNRVAPFDPLLVPTLHALPGAAPGSPTARLPFLNLMRGVIRSLPSGQTVAKLMGIPALTPDQVAAGPDGAVARRLGFDANTPLWYYILKEAEQGPGRGEHLGPVGATIVAEVLVGLVQGSATSYLGMDPKFQPSLGPTPGSFTMVDLLTFAFDGDVDPVGRLHR